MSAAWTYRQRTGQLTDPVGTPIEIGYSGAEPYINRAMAEWRENLGPIPTGDYVIGAAYDHENLGPVSMPLEPSADNEMHGRFAFFIHGDNGEGDQSASEGCIILSRTTRELIDASAVRDLTVTV